MEKYTKYANLGRGTYGNVILVKNMISLKLFALKKVLLNKNEKKQSINIENEIAILNSSDHPNIVKYIESFEHKGKLCIVMEYCDNGDLKSLISKNKKENKHINEDIIWNWFFKIGNALKYLHSKNIIHRDIKPENIFLNSTGQIKIGDFGISKILENSQEFAQTSLGTPYYLSPEICLGNTYNNKIDIWMLGCFVYEAVNFEKPFMAQNICVYYYLIKHLMNSIINHKHQRNNSIYSDDLQYLIDLLLEKNPEMRPSIAELLDLPFVKSHMKKSSPTHYNFIKYKSFMNKNTLQIEIEDTAPKSSNDWGKLLNHPTKLLSPDFNSEIEKKELEELKKNLIASSPLSNISKATHEESCILVSPENNTKSSSFQLNRNIKFVNKSVLFTKKLRSNLRTKSNNAIKNLNSKINSYEGEINLNNDNCSFYMNKSHKLKSNKKIPCASPISYYTLIKPKQNNYQMNVDLIQDNFLYERKEKPLSKFKTVDVVIEDLAGICNDFSVVAFQSRESLMCLLRKKIGSTKYNILMEALDRSESSTDFLISERVAEICGQENKLYCLEILRHIVSFIKSPSNCSISTQNTFQ